MSISPDSTNQRRRLPGSDAPAQAPSGRGLPRHLLGKLATTPTHPAITVGETLLLPLLAVVLGLAFAPQDPLLTQAAFPWPWLVPVVLALRYGPLAGLGGASVLLACWLGLNVGHWDVFPQLYFLGGLILVMLVGEFSSLWQARARRAETLQLYLDQRLEHLVRQHYLLRLSHDQLEQELIARPMSMRDALKELNQAGQDAHGAGPTPQQLLRVLSQFCQLECAAIHPVRDARPEAQPAAILGACDGLKADDPLVQQALRTGQLCHINQAVSAQQDTLYLVAAPLVDLAGDMYGLLVVRDMPFFALQQESLQTMQLLLCYYTDSLSMQRLAQPIVSQVADCPPRFAFELQRLAHMHRETQVPSVVVALEFRPQALKQDLPEQIMRLRRELDEVWPIEGPERQVLAVLMPLGTSGTAEGYVRRLEAWMQHRSQQSLAEAGIFTHVLPLDGEAPLRTVERLRALAHA